MIQTDSAMRLAFTAATTDTPREKRTRLYAMVRSALNRKLGTTKRRTMWSASRAGK